LSRGEDDEGDWHMYSLLIGLRTFYPSDATLQGRNVSKVFTVRYKGRRKSAKGAEMRTVIFDLDGTLADTSADLIGSANVCFRGLGLGNLLDPVADAATAFAGGKAMLRLGFSRVNGFNEAEVERQYPVLLAAYEADIDTYTTLYPGVIDAVERLRVAGTVVGICTNKPEGLAETLMTRLGVRGMFGALVGADTLPTRKPDPAP
jgi:phosphoglycolate phosphatase